jgi:hypothetical protein
MPVGQVSFHSEKKVKRGESCCDQCPTSFETQADIQSA